MKREEILNRLKVPLRNSDWKEWFEFCIKNEEDQWLRMQIILLYKRELREENDFFKRKKIIKSRLARSRAL